MKSITRPALLASLICVCGLSMVAVAAAEPQKPTAAADASKAKATSEPYPLATCPISGGKLGSMGDPIVKMYDGREVRFCCAKCPPKFEKELAADMAKLDEAIVKDQLALYPIDTSIVTGKKLPEKPVDWVYNNRLIRLGADTEKAEFQKDPAKYLGALNAAVVAKQSKDYPLKACPVSNEELGGMGEAKDVVIGGRLVRLCCGKCEKDVRKNPAKFIAMVDDARAGKAAGGEKK